ncbi:hypothetical protein A4G27_02185 [Mycobacterium kansasii]|nr:hypothetical protein A4G27_02185 [Mycobacterium kansasii]
MPQCGGEIRDGHASLQCRDESGNLAVGVAELALQGRIARSGYWVHLLPARQIFRVGQGRDPLVESGGHRILTEIDGARMIAQVYGHRTRLAQLAAVKDARRALSDARGTLHPPSARGAIQHPAQRIRHCRFSAADETGTTPCLYTKTNSLSQIIGDQRFVRAAVWCDPV